MADSGEWTEDRTVRPVFRRVRRERTGVGARRGCQWFGGLRWMMSDQDGAEFRGGGARR